MLLPIHLLHSHSLKGGLILHRNDYAAAEWGEMCARALKPLAVSDEPFIHTGWDSLKKEGDMDALINKDL